MSTNTTEIAFILDRSGSMQSIAESTIKGFNAFLEDRQKDHAEFPARITLSLFDTEISTPFSSLPSPEVLPLDNSTYKPDGSTALLDAIGITVKELGKRLSETSESERSSKVMVCILTDGEENSSSKYTWKEISDMIKHQRDIYKWEFLFMGANQDAIATASKISIAAEKSAAYSADEDGIRRSTKVFSQSACYFQRDAKAPSLTDMLAEEEALEAVKPPSNP